MQQKYIKCLLCVRYCLTLKYMLNKDAGFALSELHSTDNIKKNKQIKRYVMKNWGNCMENKQGTLTENSWELF